MSTDTTGTLLAADGTSLFYRDWPVERPRASLVHGLGEHATRYSHVAGRLNGIGIAVRAADHRAPWKICRGARRAAPPGSRDHPEVKTRFAL